jgi:hypothetical protein
MGSPAATAGLSRRAVITVEQQGAANPGVGTVLRPRPTIEV